jgi:hypothetical protein
MKFRFLIYGQRYFNSPSRAPIMDFIGTKLFLFLLIIAIFGSFGVYASLEPPLADTPEIANSETTLAVSLSRKSGDFKPVDNMHHFMEYVYEPTYNQLKKNVSTEPTAKEIWSKIKSGAMILAESSTLLAQRAPDKGDKDLWISSSLLVHQHGSKLFTASRQKDYEAVKKSFAAMSEGCKKCHQAFRK